MGGQPTGLPGQPMVAPFGNGVPPQPTGPTAPAPGTPLSKRDDASPIRHVSAVAPATTTDRPAQAAQQPPNVPPTPASLAIQDMAASKR